MQARKSRDYGSLRDHQLGQALAALIAQQASSSIVFNQLQDLLGDDTALLGPLRDLLGRAAFKQMLGKQCNTSQIASRDALLRDLERIYTSHIVDRLGTVLNGCLGLPESPVPSQFQPDTTRSSTAPLSNQSSIPFPLKTTPATPGTNTHPAGPERQSTDSSNCSKRQYGLIAIIGLFGSAAVAALAFNALGPLLEQPSSTNTLPTTPLGKPHPDTNSEELDQPSQPARSDPGSSGSPLILKASDLQDGQKAELIGSSIKVEFSIKPSAGARDQNWMQPAANIYENGVLVGKLTGPEGPPGFSASAAQVQIVDLDQSNETEEVLLSGFTGGAHCCGTVNVISKNSKTKQWEEITLGPFDGGPLLARDPLGGSHPLIVTRDNRFLYKFASYAGSAAPVQLWKLDKGAFLDVSHDPGYEGIHLKNLELLEKSVREFPVGNRNPNGVLAAYVATKALLGQSRTGWMIMLQKYDPKQVLGLKDCQGGYDNKGSCRKDIFHPNYPEALLAFLLSAGYVSPAEANQLRSTVLN
jgi:hypothetical protein